MMEPYFIYIVSLISAAAVLLFGLIMHQIIKLKDEDTDKKFNIILIISSFLFEIGLIAISLALINNVILNIYGYLFAFIILVILTIQVTYIVTYRKNRIK